MKDNIRFIFLQTLLLLSLFIGMWNTTAYAQELDPGAGRLSGKYIFSDFYEEGNADSSSFAKNLNRYGSRKLKSTYTGAKYTHQTRFDNRAILHGIDVSRWQGEINWNKVKADGIDYAFIQVGFRGYGSSGILNEATKDPYFHQNMQNAIDAGIRVGVYVFSQATTEAEAIEEAEYILDSIGGYNITMPLVMDFEYASTDSGLGGRLYKAKLSKKKATKVCMAFCKEIAVAGYTPMIYANKSMLEDQINASTLTDAGYRIWLANYTKKTTYKGNFDFWQYSEKGSVKGISEDVDMNFYYVQDTDDFAPAPNSISSATFSEVADQLYTGAAITPEITVTKDGVTLTPNVDYSITYSNNTKVGTATIQITGIGNYCDTRKIRFDILPNASTSLKAKKRSSNYITLSWNKDSSITGYELYRTDAINGTYKKIKTISKKSTTSYKNMKLTTGKCYYYKIRSYKKVNGKIYYSEFSPVKTIYTKTGYTKNAIANGKLPIYDYIPGTKTENITVTEPATEGEITTEVTTENDSSTEASTEDNPTEDNPTVENPSTEPSTENNPTDDTTTGDTTTEPGATDNNTTDTPTEDTTTNMVTVTKTVKVDSSVLINISKNTKMSVIYSTKHKKKTWYYVSYKKNGITYKGYVAGSQVTTAKLGKVVKTKKVNVRKKATSYSKKVTTLKKNNKVDILSTKKKAGVIWYKVQFKKKNKTYKGWISAYYIKVL